MKKKIVTLAIAIIMAQATLTSCGWNVGQGDKRGRKEILSWEDLDSSVLSDTKQKITDKMEEKGINFVDGSLINALIAIKKQTR